MPKESSNGRVTLAVLGTKLDALTISFNGFKQDFTKHLDDYKQTQFDVDRLKVSSDNRKWHFRAVWVAFISFVSAVGITYFK
jgi:hypothetical protein